MEEPSLLALLDRLDAWRHLPAYRLEPRIDALFSLYLPAVLLRRGVDIRHDVIPEFPLRRGTLWGEESVAHNASVKVDFAALSADREQLHLIEFKTDMSSLRPEQVAYLQKAETISSRDLVVGALSILEATNSEYVPKYRHLLLALARWGALTCDGRLEHLTRSFAGEPVPRLTGVSIPPQFGKLRPVVWMVQPQQTGEEHTIGFDEIASTVAGVAGQFSQSFAAKLRMWAVRPGH